MGPSGRGCTDAHPGDVGVYGIVDVFGDMLDASQVIHEYLARESSSCARRRQHRSDLLDG